MPGEAVCGRHFGRVGVLGEALGSGEASGTRDGGLGFVEKSLGVRVWGLDKVRAAGV